MAPERGINKKIAAGILAGAVALGGVGYAATRGSEQPQPIGTETPSAAAASPTPKESATPTFTATPTETSKPTEVATVPCVVIEQKYCDQGDLIHWKNQQGNIIILIGFKLPQDAQIFSPVEGQLGKSAINQPNPFEGNYAQVVDPKEKVTYTFIGDIKFPDMVNKTVPAGTVIGGVDNKNIHNLGQYNLLIGVERVDQGKLVEAEDIIKKLFPVISTKTPLDVSYDGPTSGVTVITATTAPSSRP